MLLAGDIEMGHARALLSLDRAEQILMAHLVVQRRLSVRYGAGGGGDLVGIHGLDGVDDDDFGLMLFQGRLNRFHADFGKQVYAFGGQFQTLRAQGDLLGGFFAGNVQHFAALRHFGDGLQQQRGFADAGVAAEQDDRAIDQTAAQYAVEFAHAGRIARHFGGGHGG